MLENDKEIESFRRWIEKNTKLGPNSVSDTISRARRAGKLVDMDKVRDIARINVELDNALKSSSAFIKCQVKLAAARFVQFKRDAQN